AAAVYEPLTAAAGLDNFSLHTTDGDRPLTEQESALLTEKASQARTLAAKYTVGAVLGLLLFSGSLVLLVRVFFVSSRLRASGGSTEAIPAEQSSAGAERSADTGAAAETGDERRAEPEAEALPAAENSAEAAAGACPSAPDGSGENSAGIAASPENQTKG
ncbi:MAG: hypothetical protein PUC59_07070, partial [Firmicutes bacterium]|nr:hypothetical protein [Bacillota bacterium]